MVGRGEEGRGEDEEDPAWWGEGQREEASNGAIRKELGGELKEWSEG